MITRRFPLSQLQSVQVYFSFLFCACVSIIEATKNYSMTSLYWEKTAFGHTPWFSSIDLSVEVFKPSVHSTVRCHYCERNCIGLICFWKLKCLLEMRLLQQWTDAGAFPEVDSAVSTGSDYQGVHYCIFLLVQFLYMLSTSLLLLFVCFARTTIIVFCRVANDFILYHGFRPFF